MSVSGVSRPRSRVLPGRGALSRLGLPGLIAAVVVAVVGLATFWPQLLTGVDPNAIAPADALSPPGARYWFGTDTSGRDVFARVVHGASQSVGIGLAATGIGVGLGVVIGFASGLGPAWLDAGLRRVIEVLFALPTLVLALLLVAVMGPGVRASVIAVGLATAPGYARILRARIRTVARAGYVEAARLEGAGPFEVPLRHVVPNSLWPLLAMITLGIGQAIVWVAALSFLGLGALPPSPEWGAMVNGGRLYIASAWWLTVCPGLAITVTAGALTVLGRAVGRVGRR